MAANRQRIIPREDTIDVSDRGDEPEEQQATSLHATCLR